MKIYELYDEEINLSLGILLYYEKEKTFIIELKSTLDEWTAPLLFSSFVKRGIFTIPREIALLWVRERIIPSGRQNIGQILTNHKLAGYDEMTFLEIAEGRCSQDSIFIRKIDNLPRYALSSRKQNLTDVTLLDGKALLCFFADGTTKKITLSKLPYIEGLDKVINNDLLFNSCTFGTDGYYITFNNSIDFPSWFLYKEGVRIPLTHSDFLSFAKGNLLDTTASCNILECSRQNLAYLTRQDYLHPVKENVKGNLYLKSDVLRQRW